ncbi:MAG: HEAT repeat domain-containing protein [Thermoguttaceae bacterium]|jgi:HEAT repeat protein
MTTQSNTIGIGAAIVGADGDAKSANFKYKPNPRPDRMFDKSAVDKSLEALKTFDWGSNYDDILAIDDALTATHGDAAARKDLENRLAAVLKTNSSRAAKDFACRMISQIGSADSVPALAGLLTEKDLSHMARYALERIGGPESLKAMRDALPKASSVILKAGIIESLGARRDGASVDVLTALAGQTDKTLAFAAINDLGKIGTPEAAQSLSDIVKKTPDDLKPIAADACLVCAERLSAKGNKAQAMLLYKGLSGEDQPKYVRLAATRGLLAAAKKE